MMLLNMVAANEVKVEFRWGAEEGHAVLVLSEEMSGEDDDYMVAVLSPDQCRSIAVWWAGVDPGSG